ncbi:hypothetical protein [Actinokineospora bangkokensis]|uniref:Uncharacterized protein n=1 Tax=Actinokineospora bangkokensis TaxID=1193682 RepID=A0A1Q9LQG5_9PSEU|nr:hypothetical protein [Actinokineospora bangkokensis]OLR94262.1 hypothetical protein BJP25_10785 [Actinokineospora bangkokensis]
MSTAFGQMESSLRGYLAELSTRAATGSGLRDLARLELPRVVSALRALLAEHHPDADGRCPTCRTRLFSRAPAPCRALLTTHLCLLALEEERAEDPGSAYAKHVLPPS